MVNSSQALKTTSYSVLMKQSIELGPMYLQGGPGKTVSEFKGKNIEGEFSLFPRIDQNNQLENAVLTLISAAQNYREYMSLTTLLNPYNTTITPDNESVWRAYTNSLVYQYCVIESLTIKATATGDVTMTIKILGQTDDEYTTPITIPLDEANIYRKLTWHDCMFQRDNSQMENAIEFELTVTKTLDQPYFLIPFAQIERYDRPYSTGVKAVEVKFKVVEHLNSLTDMFTYSLGGWALDIAFSGNFGPIFFQIPKSLLQISTQNLSPDIITRTTSGYYQMRPDTPDAEDFLLTLPS